MRQSSWKWLPSVLGLACGLVAGGVRAQDLLTLEAPADAEVRDLLPRSGASSPSEGDAVHEVIRSPAVARVTEPVEKSPPSPINERPGVHPPGPDHQWIEGYWAWDKSRKDFVWVTGTWIVPPPGSFWVNGHWRRDESGWTRVSGFWSGRQGEKVDWRKTGPPADRPEEAVGPAPRPDSFYVAGHYVPDGDGVAWKPGFWSRSHPGWEWAPARWVRQPSGWAFREGHWNRDTNAGERRAPQNGAGSPVRAGTIVSTPADAGSAPLEASGPASAAAPSLFLDAEPPLTAPALPPDEASQPSDGESNPIGSTLPPPLTPADSLTDLNDNAYLDGSIERGGMNPSGSSPTRADGVTEFDLPSAAGDVSVPYLQPGEPGNSTLRGRGLPEFAPGYVLPDARYAPRVYLRSGPYIYRRGYNGGRLRNVVPRARGLLNRVLPR